MVQYKTITVAVFFIFFACALPFISSLLCSPLCFFSGSHFLCPSTFFFVLFQFPLSSFSPSHIYPPTEKNSNLPLSSFCLHCTPSILFSHIPLLLLSLPFFFSFAMVLSFFCISRSCFIRSLSMNIFSVSFSSLSFSLLFHHFFFPTPLFHFH
jgi:hypothetical protein